MKQVKFLLLFVAMMLSVSAFAENNILYLTKASYQDLRAGDEPVPMTVSYTNGTVKISYDQSLVGSVFTISTMDGQTLYNGYPQVSNGSFVLPATLNSSDMYLLMIENSEGMLYTVFTLADL